MTADLWRSAGWLRAPAIGVALALLAGGAHAVTPLVVAGGGGGAGGDSAFGVVRPGAGGTATTSGSEVPDCFRCGDSTIGGVGGMGGPGGAVSTIGEPVAGGGGAGIFGPGGEGTGLLVHAGNTFLGDPATAGWGGASSPSFAGGLGVNYDGVYANGGFGGGGGGGLSGGGGGGGYSGGSGGDDQGGGGGGSFIAASLSPVQEVGGQNGDPTEGDPGLNGWVSINGVIWSTPGVYDYRVPTSGVLDITAVGAQGGGDEYTVPPYSCPSSGGVCGGNTFWAVGGYGAVAEGSGTFGAGQLLEIVVGGAGNQGDVPNFNYGGAGGGGGSFVLALPEPAAWLVMVLGFGAVGVAMRRARRQGASRGTSGAAAERRS
ncbi:MAG TPA: hypothetical protein VG248_03930 [Caulobacteraceae bacterium]|nr:hypothetical protein [Caulobacteraceae bacterium]